MKNFIEVTSHKNRIPLQHMKLLEKFYNVEIFMKKSNLKESTLEEGDSFNIHQAYVGYSMPFRRDAVFKGLTFTLILNFSNAESSNDLRLW